MARMSAVAERVRMQLDPLTSPAMLALIEAHLSLMHSQSSPGAVHAMAIERLRAPGVRVWSAWLDDALVGCGALQRIGPREGEIKSMHVVAASRGTGVASAILRHIEAQARADGMVRLSLETGSQPAFEPARRLYAAHGYVACGCFADYRDDPRSAFMTKAL